VQGVDAVYVPTRTYVDIAHSLREAVDRWHRAAAGSRLYVVRTHLSSAEEDAWQRAFTSLGLTPHVRAVGVDPLLVLGPSTSSPASASQPPASQASRSRA